MGFHLKMDMDELMEEIFKKKKKSHPEGAAPQAVPAQEEEIGESSATKQSRDVMIAFAFIIIVCVSYVVFYYFPRTAEIEKKATSLDTLAQQEDGLSSLDDQIKNRSQHLAKSYKNYLTILSYFDKNQELEDLYKSVSDIAVSNNLTVKNIRAEAKAPAKVVVEGEEEKPKQYTTNRVYIELSGKYANYMKFKKDLINAKKLLTVHNELITLIKTKSSSHKVVAKLNLSTYTIDKAPYSKALDTIKNKGL